MRRQQAAIALYLTVAALSGAPVGAEQTAALVFSWACVVQGRDAVIRPIDYSQSEIRSHSGDRFKFYLKPESPCYIYLYLFDAQRKLFLLFPEKLQPNAGRARSARTYELPGLNSWYLLDEHPGREVFYLIVSKTRQNELEQRTERYLENRQAVNKYAVVDQIKRIIKENSYLAGAAEKPVAVAGDFRGISEERFVNGLKIRAEDLYVKTIRLVH
jgi:hypothetical protein